MTKSSSTQTLKPRPLNGWPIKITILFSMMWSLPGYSEDTSIQLLQQAQQSFLKNDGNSLVKNLKEALIQSKNHPFAVKNASQIYLSAESKGMLKNIKPDWQVPAELQYLNVSVQRKYMYEGGKVRFFLSSGATLSERGIVEQFQLIQYPNRVIFDKLAKVGDWKEQEWDGKPTFWISEDWHAEQVPEGLYLLNIKVKNRPMVQGWFLINDENSSASPVVKVPSLNQIFTTDQPTFVWNNFRSPELNSEDHTKIGLKITREETDLYEEITNLKLIFNPERTEVAYHLGDRSTGLDHQGATRLKPGKYQLNLGYREMHSFGDLYIVRVSTSKIPFTVESNKGQ